jgi:hypothetical protein
LVSLERAGGFESASLQQLGKQRPASDCCHAAPSAEANLINAAGAHSEHELHNVAAGWVFYAGRSVGIGQFTNVAGIAEVI